MDYCRLYLILFLFGVVAADETTCNSLRNLNAASIGFVDGDCACADPTAETTRDTCSSCFKSGSSTTFKGIATSTATKNKTGTTFSQRTDVELCFEYEDGVYKDVKVCYSYSLFGTGEANSQCTVTVDGTACNQCQKFTKETLAFDCSNVSYEVRQDAPVVDAVQGTVLQFLSNTQSDTVCAASSGGSTPSSSNGYKLLPGFFLPIAYTLLFEHNMI